MSLLLDLGTVFAFFDFLRGVSSSSASVPLLSDLKPSASVSSLASLFTHVLVAGRVMGRGRRKDIRVAHHVAALALAGFGFGAGGFLGGGFFDAIVLTGRAGVGFCGGDAEVAGGSGGFGGLADLDDALGDGTRGGTV